MQLLVLLLICITGGWYCNMCRVLSISVNGAAISRLRELGLWATANTTKSDLLTNNFGMNCLLAKETRREGSPRIRVITNRGRRALLKQFTSMHQQCSIDANFIAANIRTTSGQSATPVTVILNYEKAWIYCFRISRTTQKIYKLRSCYALKKIAPYIDPLVVLFANGFSLLHQSTTNNNVNFKKQTKQNPYRILRLFSCEQTF